MPSKKVKKPKTKTKDKKTKKGINININVNSHNKRKSKIIKSSNDKQPLSNLLSTAPPTITFQTPSIQQPQYTQQPYYTAQQIYKEPIKQPINTLNESFKTPIKLTEELDSPFTTTRKTPKISLKEFNKILEDYDVPKLYGNIYKTENDALTDYKGRNIIHDDVKPIATDISTTYNNEGNIKPSNKNENLLASLAQKYNKKINFDKALLSKYNSDYYFRNKEELKNSTRMNTRAFDLLSNISPKETEERKYTETFSNNPSDTENY